MKALTQPPELATIKDEIDRFFHRVLDGNDFAWMSEGDWQPALDLTETRDAVVCRIDVPGMEPEHLHVTLRDGVLTVRGERKMEKEEKEATRYRLERKVGTFARAVRLPVAVDGTKVDAQFKNGVLTILLPRMMGKAGLPEEVPIRVA